MSDENQNFITNSDGTNSNNSRTEYSFWAEQTAARQSEVNESTNNSYDINTRTESSSASENNVPSNDSASHVINYNYSSSNSEYTDAFFKTADTVNSNTSETSSPKKKKHFRKICSFTTKAALFGVIAAAGFIGFNQAYYHMNPDALPIRPRNASNTKNSNGSSLNLGSTSKENQLSTTTVSKGVTISSGDVSDLVEKTMPATVSISSVFSNSYYVWGQQYNQEDEGGGSGIIIGKTDTELLIATNNHVVEDASKIIINFIDNSTADATIKGRDSAADLAVVSVDISKLSEETLNKIEIATLGDSDSVKVGQMVVAIGNALGYGQSVTVGYISAKDREISISNNNTKMTVLQTDAAINPGNSGGALINMNGEVIGINSAKLANTDVEGIGYAIPISNALPIVNDLKDREVLADEDKGYIGIYPQDVSSSVAQAYNWPEGVYVSDLLDGGAAQKAGILKGDIITSINGITLTTSDQLRELVNSYRYGTSVSVTYERIKDGIFEEHTLDVVLQKNTSTSSTPNEDATIKEGTDNTAPSEEDSRNSQGDSNQEQGENQNPNNRIPDNRTPNTEPSPPQNDSIDDLQDFFNNLFP